MQTTKFHFTIDAINIQSRKLFPVEIIRANSFKELVQSTCDFVADNDPDFLDSCVITSWNIQNGAPKTIPFSAFAVKIAEHIFENTDLGGTDIEAFKF